MTLQKIEFEYDIPDGYRFVKYDVPKKNEYYLINGNPIKSGGYNTCDYPIVEKIPEQERPSHNTKRRKHADLIHAWAEGAEIQYQKANGSWDCVLGNRPAWSDCEIYRVKPKTRIVRFRNYISCSGNIYVASDSEQIGQDHKWLGDWQNVEIEEND